MAVFYCTDPYIQGYGRRQDVMSDIPYSRRHWLTDLPQDGCHRVVLCAEVMRFFVERGVSVQLWEIDQTFDVIHTSQYAPPGNTGASTASP